VPFVVDLSALWAGPLCANLLAASGARVVKVESPTRPDAMRRGSSSFFEMLHRGHEQLVLAITEPKGLSALRRLLDAADIVVEASRPRALAQLGINAWDYVERGATWVSITGYGRAQPERVGFGDDVGVAAGLVAGDVDAPMFCADAIADPIAGLHAAVAAMAVLARGGGRLIDVSMAGAARTARGGRFVDATSVAVAPPRSRPWR
jgi:crotonobetainyl-CoA:carnitine CoA-transferase CaiB-like acyl-CoA transferase